MEGGFEYHRIQLVGCSEQTKIKTTQAEEAAEKTLHFCSAGSGTGDF
jgi:hypothetical protein